MNERGIEKQSVLHLMRVLVWLSPWHATGMAAIPMLPLSQTLRSKSGRVTTLAPMAGDAGCIAGAASVARFVSREQSLPIAEQISMR